MTLSQAFAGLSLGINWILGTVRAVFETQVVLGPQTRRAEWSGRVREGRFFPEPEHMLSPSEMFTHEILFSTVVLSWSI